MTDYLGDDHDLLVLRETIEHADLMRPATQRAVFRAMDERRAELQGAARYLAQKLFAGKAKRLLRGLAELWEVEAERKVDEGELVG